MKLSGELDYRIRYDVEHDLFHAQNVFNDEYIKPTFIEYVQKLEKENAELKEHHKSVCEILTNTHRSIREQLTKAKEILEELAKMEYVINPPVDKVRSLMVKAEQFLKE